MCNGRVLALIASIAIVLTFLELTFGLFDFQDRTSIFRLIGGILFFNTAHTLASHLLPFIPKEYQQTRFQNRLFYGAFFSIPWLILFTVFFFLVRASFESLLVAQTMLVFILTGSLWNGFRRTEALYKLQTYRGDEAMRKSTRRKMMSIDSKMLRASKTSSRTRWIFRLALIPYAGLVFFSAHIVISDAWFSISSNSILYAVLLAVGYSFIFNHCFIEMFIFRFRASDIRKNILPILKTKDTNDT